MTEPIPAAAAPVLFYDSADYVFPDGATHVMEYADGTYENHTMRDLYPFVHDITVLGEAAAWHAQFADYELDNPVYGTPGALRDWVEARLARGLRAVPYSLTLITARLELRQEEGAHLRIVLHTKDTGLFLDGGHVSLPFAA